MRPLWLIGLAPLNVNIVLQTRQPATADLRKLALLSNILTSQINWILSLLTSKTVSSALQKWDALVTAAMFVLLIRHLAEAVTAQVTSRCQNLSSRICAPVFHFGFEAVHAAKPGFSKAWYGVKLLQQLLQKKQNKTWLELKNMPTQSIFSRFQDISWCNLTLKNSELTRSHCALVFKRKQKKLFIIHLPVK